MIEYEEYLLVPKRDFEKLSSIAKAKCKIKLTKDEIIFLGSVLSVLHMRGEVEIEDDLIHLKLSNEANKVDTIFTRMLLEKYYNKVDEFVNLIL